MDRMPERIDSKFRYVLLAALRAEQMMRGGRPKIDMGAKKSTRVAMEEISNDLVDWGMGPAEEELLEVEEEALEIEA
ncbi:MAG: DNA-directed RNA polymerase subunit omega [Acidobacteria bacterium]|nr:MAG: DNA-directed RNA polymerase subunit omega [Acidobacteriota bacterium]